MPTGTEKQLDKEALAQLIKDQEAAYLEKGNEIVKYAGDPGRIPRKPGEYEARKRRPKNNYQEWLDEVKGEKGVS